MLIGESQSSFVLVLEMTQDAPPKTPRILKIPQPDVCIKQQPQSRRTSHSSSSFAGETMSPRISNVPFIDPIQASRSAHRRRRNDFSHGLAKSRDADGLFCSANLFQYREAFGFELRDGDFPHGSLSSHSIVPWSIYLTIEKLKDLTVRACSPRPRRNPNQYGSLLIHDCVLFPSQAFS